MAKSTKLMNHMNKLESYKDETTLPFEATFVSHRFPEKTLYLLPKLAENVYGQWQHMEGTGFKITFRAHQFRTKSKAIAKWLIDHDEFDRKVIEPDPEDPSGFWRTLAGAQMRVETREVLTINNVGQIKSKDLDFKKLDKLDPDAMIPPLVVVKTEGVPG